MDRQTTILSFQGVRGWAILLIILSHCNYILNDYGNNVFMYTGAFGVELFILLSGYLAYYNYSCNLDKSLLTLLINKVKKFYPLHIITFIASLPLSMYIFQRGKIVESVLKVILNLLFLNAWIPKMDIYFSFNDVSWYLTLIIFFAVITPILIKTLAKLSNNILFVIMVAVIVGEFVWAYLVSDSPIYHWYIYIYMPICERIRFFKWSNRI